MITETDPRFLKLHPQFLKVIQNDERKLRFKIAAGVPACLEGTPTAVREPLERMLSAFTEMIIGRVFEDLIESFTVMSDVIRSQEPWAPKPTDIN
jgi:hypothetical protein